jgi:hypothetical protein
LNILAVVSLGVVLSSVSAFIRSAKPSEMIFTGAAALAVVVAAIAATAQSLAGTFMIYVPGFGQVVLNWQAKIVALVLFVLLLLILGVSALLWRGSRVTKILTLVFIFATVQFGVPMLLQAVPRDIMRAVKFYYSQLRMGTDPEIIKGLTEESIKMFGSVKRQFDHPVEISGIFTEEECKDMVNDIWLLKDRWTHWGSSAAFLPFFTLGAASYLENRWYHESAAYINPLMETQFGWIYPRLLAGLEKGVGAKVRYHSDALSSAPALPGFHIFLSNLVWQLPVARVHYDGQYASIKTFPKDADFHNPLSFTVSIQLPTAGQAGLLVYADKFEKAQIPVGQNVTTFETTKGNFQKVREFI